MLIRRPRPSRRTLSLALALALALAAARAAPPGNPPPPAAGEALAAAVAPRPSPAAEEVPAPAAEPPARAVRAPWQNDPIAATLKVGVERRIDFPEPIADLDVPQELERQSRIVLSPTGQLHWTARVPFEPARILATSVGGTLYQLDVGARSDGAAPPPLAITDPVLEAAAAAKANAPDERARRERAAGALLPDFLKGEAAAARAGGADYAALARFALAHYAGPARLIPKLEASRVKVAPVSARAWLRVQAAYLAVLPLAQWKVGERYVTAVGAYNRSPREAPFDPRALRGDLRFAAALHPILGPAGSGHSGTVWAVVTDRPFNEAIDP